MFIDDIANFVLIVINSSASINNFVDGTHVLSEHSLQSVKTAMMPITFHNVHSLIIINESGVRLLTIPWCEDHITDALFRSTYSVELQSIGRVNTNWQMKNITK